ncbi:MAG: hypothetical protein U9N51_08160 [Bacteroidota bacterium]|nr:hypothetical protein [Bacteroidota bacterium]
MNNQDDFYEERADYDSYELSQQEEENRQALQDTMDALGIEYDDCDDINESDINIWREGHGL